MKIRKLKQEEHRMTRSLWEEIFTEDDEAFLDYYYQVKTAENSIYIIEEEDQPVSMLQLNPYPVQFLGETCLLHYIIAVATKMEYRGRGYMTRLLEKSAKDMYQAGEPFTYLMPAAEEIYYPHGFRFVYRQLRIEGKPSGEKGQDGTLAGCQVRYAGESDCRALACFAEKLLGQMPFVRAARTERYYRTILKEQQSEGGGILLTERDGKLTGFVIYGCYERKAELREPLFEKKEDWEQILAFLNEEPVKIVQISGTRPEDAAWLKEELEGAEEKEVPVIMVRIVHLQHFLERFLARSNFEIRLHIEDGLIPENTGYWEIRGQEGQTLSVRKTKASKEAETVSPGELVTVLFGYRSERKEEREVYENMGPQMRVLLKGTQPAPPVFLNEIV